MLEVGKESRAEPWEGHWRKQIVRPHATSLNKDDHGFWCRWKLAPALLRDHSVNGCLLSVLLAFMFSMWRSVGLGREGGRLALAEPISTSKVTFPSYYNLLLRLPSAYTHTQKMISWRLALALVSTFFKGVHSRNPRKGEQTWPTSFSFRFQAAIEKVCTAYSKYCIGNSGCDGFVHCSDMGIEHIQKPNSWTHNFVEVSGHNLFTLQTSFEPLLIREGEE